MRSRSWAIRFAILTAAALAACGGGGAGADAPKGPTAAASAKPPANTTLSPPPSGLPPMAPMPPPGVTGSRKGKERSDAALVSCTGGAKLSAKSPTEHVRRVGEACKTATRMHIVGDTWRGERVDKDAHAEQKIRVEANKCYRVYFATDENVRDAVVVMRDSAGDIVTESPGPAVPERGAVCFTSSDEVTLLLSVGSGKGAYAAEVWSN